MLALPNTLALITTRRCTAACDHCCFGSSPRETESIPIERLHSLIDEAGEVSTIRLIAFTGGECFLLGSTLDDLVARATRLGFRTRCVTNGYWATNEKAACKRVSSLRGAGLCDLYLSTGHHHARFVPIDRVAEAARAGVEFGMRVAISVEAFDAASIRSEEIASHPTIAGFVADGKIRLDSNPWLPDHAARGSSPIGHINPNPSWKLDALAPCNSIMNVLSVLPNQQLVSCCGFPIESIEALWLGSVAELTLKQVLANAPNDFMKMWIHAEGPAKIIAFVKERDPSYETPEECVSICQMCHHLFQDRRALSVIKEHYKLVEDDVVNRYLARSVARQIKAMREEEASGSPYSLTK